jgi:hypothetical protein
LAAVVALVLWYVFQRTFEARIGRRQAMELTLAEHRQKLYERFMSEYWVKALEGEMTPDAGIAFMRRWSQEAWLVASDSVIHAAIRLSAGVDDQEEMLRVASRLMVAIRRDMGNPAGFPAVGEREFLRLMIKVGDWGQIEHVMQRVVPDRTHKSRFPPRPLLPPKE